MRADSQSLLSWVLIRQGDAVGLVAHNESVTNYTYHREVHPIILENCAFIGGVGAEWPNLRKSHALPCQFKSEAFAISSFSARLSRLQD